MSDLKQDSAGHLVIEDHALVLVSGVQEVSQRLAQRLRTFAGEWFLDNTIGVPWKTQILEKQVPQAPAILKREILDTPGILELKSFNFSLDKATRIASIEAEVISVDGEVNLEVTV